MKVMLVSPPSQSAIKTVLGVTGPPLGLGYLASTLEEEGAEVKIVDSLAMDYGLGDVKNEIKKFDPEIVGITSTTPTIYDAYEVAKVAKETNPNCKTVIGGPHATFMAKETLEDCPYLDFVVKGEGENIIKELVSNYEHPKDVRGITFREDGKIKDNGGGPLIKNLDEIPFPAHHLFSNEKYKVGNTRYTAMITSRGCPFNCIFCSSSKLCGKTWRGRSPENVLEEIRLLVDEYKVREIEILDDTFTLNKKRAEEICDLVIKEGLDVSWSCSSRADTLTERLAEKLKKAGCHSIYLGIESGTQKILDFIKKGITLEQAKTAVKKAKNSKLNTLASFIIGVPRETREMMEATIKFAKRLKPTFAQFTIFTPYPGTEAYDFAEKKNLLLTKDWSKYTTLDPVLKIPGIGAKELKRLLRRAYLSFYLRPSIIPTLIRKRFWAIKALLRSLKSKLL